MKRILALAALLAVGVAAHAQQEDASVAAERARLHEERTKVEAAYKVEEKACYGKFAVNDCLAKARAKRREAVSDLRRQEIALNDAERKRKAAERQRSIDERNAAARGPASAPSDADRQLRANERAAERAAQAASAPAKAAEREKQVRKKEADIKASAQRRADDAARAAKEHEQRLAEAKEREEKLKQRQADRKKAPASSLADPR
jgi:colicin import membrane protein